jgi:Thrombospondin type 1 domain
VSLYNFSQFVTTRASYTNNFPPSPLSRAVTVVDDDVCLELAGNKPATTASCNEGKVCPMWFTGKWQPCNKLCGEGKQTRQVICYRKEENGRITVLDNADCQDEKPAEAQDCMVTPCEGVEYIASSWSGVSIDVRRDALDIFKRSSSSCSRLIRLVRRVWNGSRDENGSLCIESRKNLR